MLRHGKDTLLETVDFYRTDAFGRAGARHRAALGQFGTPPAIASFMASLFSFKQDEVRLLDAGAGVGSLTAAFVHEACSRDKKPRSIQATVVELDEAFGDYLSSAVNLCQETCREADVTFTGRTIQDDFIGVAVGLLNRTLYDRQSFNCAILNPPYRKISSDSDTRRLLRVAGIETSNLYAGFLALTIKLLDNEGELVAITPRSFCNGPYFHPFRKLLLELMDIRRVHVFESRDRAFADSDVLQENIIIHAVRRKAKSPTLIISSSEAPGAAETIREVSTHEFVHPRDGDLFMHIVPEQSGGDVARRMRALEATLPQLGLSVSTGRVVEFRCKEHLLAEPAPGAVPLIYPAHFCQGFIRWPKAAFRKPNAAKLCDAMTPWLIPSALYVLTKRFSAKEEKRRVVAAVYDPAAIPADLVGFENHLNYFYGPMLDLEMAKGLTLFLNSTVVDEYFRQFNGHTQVNATDLRNMAYPSQQQLRKIGQQVNEAFPEQADIDQIVEQTLWGLG